jgi:hypothetical protein
MAGPAGGRKAEGVDGATRTPCYRLPAVDPLFELLARDVVRVAFDLAAHWPRVRTLLARYERMDLADTSIVIMSELHARSQVLTVDRREFTVYRRHDRQVIDLIAPPAQSS